jgi:hypothetical protein
MTFNIDSRPLSQTQSEYATMPRFCASYENMYTLSAKQESPQAKLAISLLLPKHKKSRSRLPTYQLQEKRPPGLGSGIISLRNSYWARVRLLGYALLMLLSRCCLYIYSQLILREFFYHLSDFSNNLLGLKSYLVTSDGEVVDNPKYYRTQKRKLRKAHKEREQRDLVRWGKKGAIAKN